MNYLVFVFIVCYANSNYPEMLFYRKAILEVHLPRYRLLVWNRSTSARITGVPLLWSRPDLERTFVCLSIMHQCFHTCFALCLHVECNHASPSPRALSSLLDPTPPPPLPVLVPGWVFADWSSVTTPWGPLLGLPLPASSTAVWDYRSCTWTVVGWLGRHLRDTPA